MIAEDHPYHAWPRLTLNAVLEHRPIPLLAPAYEDLWCRTVHAWMDPEEPYPTNAAFRLATYWHAYRERYGRTPTLSTLLATRLAKKALT